MKFYPTYFYPRSGSTVVDNLLNQHPEVTALNEPLSVFNNPSLLEIGKNDSDINFKSFMQPVIERLGSSKTKKIVSFQYNTFHLKQFIAKLDNQKHIFFVQKYFGKLIVIRRKNLLKQLISYQVANESKVLHYRSTEFMPNPRLILPLRVSCRFLNEFLSGTHTNEMGLIDFFSAYEQYINQTIDHLKTSNMPWLDIVYEDHIEQSPLTAVKMIEDFLGIDNYNNYHVPLQRHATSLKETLTNHAEIVDYLAWSKHAWMLET